MSKPLQKSFILDRFDAARIDHSHGFVLQDFRPRTAHLDEDAFRFLEGGGGHIGNRGFQVRVRAVERGEIAQPDATR